MQDCVNWFLNTDSVWKLMPCQHLENLISPVVLIGHCMHLATVVPLVPPHWTDQVAFGRTWRTHFYQVCQV